MATQPPETEPLTDGFPEGLNGQERTSEEWAKLAATWSLKGYHESRKTRIETREAIQAMTKTVKQWVIGGVLVSVVLGRAAGWLMHHWHLIP